MPKKSDMVRMSITAKKYMKDISCKLGTPMTKSINIMASTTPVIIDSKIIRLPRTKRRKLRLYGMWEFDL